MTILSVSVSDLVGQAATPATATSSAGWQQFQDLLDTAISQNQTSDVPPAPPPSPATPSLDATTQAAEQAQAVRSADAKALAAARQHRLALRSAAATASAATPDSASGTAATTASATATVAGAPAATPSAATPSTETPATTQSAAAASAQSASSTSGATDQAAAADPSAPSSDAAAGADPSTTGPTADHTDQTLPGQGTPLPLAASAAAIADAAAALQTQAVKTAAAAVSGTAGSATLAGLGGLLAGSAARPLGADGVKPGTGIFGATAGGDATAALAAGLGSGTAGTAGYGGAGDAASRTGSSQGDGGDQGASSGDTGDSGSNDASSGSSTTETGQGTAPPSLPAALTNLLTAVAPLVATPTATTPLTGLSSGREGAAGLETGLDGGDPTLTGAGLGLAGHGPATSAPLANEASAAATPYAATQSPYPVEQVAVAIGRYAGGARSFTVQLDPEHLGTVDVRIDVDAKGKTKVAISADRPETLALLKIDSHHLVKALQDAGMSAESGSLNFSLRGQTADTAQDRRNGASRNSRGTTPMTETEPATEATPVRATLSRHLYDIRA